MKIIKVGLRERSYDITIGEGIGDEICRRIKGLPLGEKIAVVTNPGLKKLYGAFLLTILKKAGYRPFLIEVPDGEGTKDLKWAKRLYDEFINARMDRRSSLVALGGGVIGDLGGFAASTFMRGIPYIQIPTSLLAQVDSSVGGKTAVNHPEGKNLIGTFYQPLAVFIDTVFLKTLPKEEFLNGMAEVVKYGIIADKRLFRFLEKNVERVLALDRQAMEYLIERSCSIKARVVGKDEREAGLRAILNFGHTLAHAIETVSGYRYRHGEAVSIGMVYAANLSLKMGLCSETAVKRIENLLLSLGLPVKGKRLSSDRLVKALETDKKVLNGKIRFVLLREIGKVEVQSDIPKRLIQKVLESA